ncbi:MAG: hypothetical protein H6Q25_211 [Bacteroidetes bacterium]|nr:hypothetical protein [Bacteroidota bacterium]
MKLNRTKIFILFLQLILIGIWNPIYSNSLISNKLKDSTKTYCFEGELKVGKISPTSPRFAPSGTLYSLLFSFGEINHNSENQWARFHNFPITGITLGFTNLGNPDVYGYECKLIPYVEYCIGKKWSYRPSVKVGLGFSYTTQYYRTNPSNIALGSPINWAFELTFRQNILTTPYGIFRLGVGYVHSSDGHTQLPNMGINGLVTTISFMHFQQSNTYSYKNKWKKPEKENEIYYFLQFNPILGIHELGGPLGPVGGPKRGVYGSNFMGGLVLNRGFKFYVGFGYRYYDHFNYVYQHDQHPDIEKYNSGVAFASNFYILNGLELMYGHFGFTFEGGLNLYKPFYKTYCDLYSPENPTKYILKKYLNSRIGIKIYRYNINKGPKFNYFIGAHVNANLGQADFTEFSIGILRNFIP